MPYTGTGDTTWDDFSTFSDKILEDASLFVVNGVPLIDTETADFTPHASRVSVIAASSVKSPPGWSCHSFSLYSSFARDQLMRYSSRMRIVVAWTSYALCLVPFTLCHRYGASTPSTKTVRPTVNSGQYSSASPRKATTSTSKSSSFARLFGTHRENAPMATPCGVRRSSGLLSIRPAKITLL